MAGPCCNEHAATVPRTVLWRSSCMSGHPRPQWIAICPIRAGQRLPRTVLEPSRGPKSFQCNSSELGEDFSLGCWYFGWEGFGDSVDDDGGRAQGSGLPLESLRLPVTLRPVGLQRVFRIGSGTSMQAELCRRGRHATAVRLAWI